MKEEEVEEVFVRAANSPEFEHLTFARLDRYLSHYSHSWLNFNEQDPPPFPAVKSTVIWRRELQGKWYFLQFWLLTSGRCVCVCTQL